jgi:extracellular factor (EF) 3-hydroxypalmitic acid methyl ester biosynthesis protein
LFARRQLHPLLLCSPFLNRCYVKPLGYAGDYEMVNMMLRSPYEGESLFAKVMNVWFLQQAPAEAHRNRIDYLVRQLVGVCARALRYGRRARILNVACGPAQEVQRFLATQEISSQADISLLDFNEETLTNTRALMNEFKHKYQRGTTFNYIKKSVYNIVKESNRILHDPAQPKYDFVYCAGLFDYLSDQVCQHMMDVMYEWLAPGGLLVATNVDTSNPRRLTMDYVMAWHLIYRSGAGLMAVKPQAAAADDCRVVSDITGVNVYLEATKPERE